MSKSNRLSPVETIEEMQNIFLRQTDRQEDYKQTSKCFKKSNCSRLSAIIKAVDARGDPVRRGRDAG